MSGSERATGAVARAFALRLLPILSIVWYAAARFGWASALVVLVELALLAFAALLVLGLRRE